MTRTPDPTDQRRLNITLTPAIRVRIDEVLDAFDAVIRKGDRDLR